MNSEPWRDPLQKLWQQQPLPRAGLHLEERVLADVQQRRDAWEEAWSASERNTLYAVLLLLAPKLLGCAWAPDVPSVAEVTIILALVAQAALILGARWRRRRVAGRFDQTLLSIIAQSRAVLRERMLLTRINLWFVPVLGIAVGALLFELTHGALATAIAIGVVTAIGLARWFVLEARRDRVRWQQQLERLAQLQQQLVDLPEPGAPG